jgi:hypothetical protein
MDGVRVLREPAVAAASSSAAAAAEPELRRRGHVHHAGADVRGR